ncbi:MAG TPA: hypothetical protein VFU02_11020 [Polyangiaceae bacterium]|nr:hypothetical protein [Polyangiaceae bacterium]
MSSPTSSRSKQRQCEVLGELFSGPTGVASVGRMLRGTELGRLVFLRSVPEASTATVKSYIDDARCVAHPSLLKVIGRVETPDTIYVASEYISGVSLMELVDNAISREQRIQTAVAIRIIRDALQAAWKAKQLFAESMGMQIRRSIFPDTVWIAEFGEIMLTEVGVASILVDGHGEGDEPTPDYDEDVTAAGAELLKLLTNQPLEEAEMTLPLAGDLASIVARAVNPSAAHRYKSAREMADALSQLPRDMIADEATVGDQVRKLMASVLAVRHPRRLMSVAAPTRPGGGDATCVFRDSADYGSSLAPPSSSDPGLPMIGAQKPISSRPPVVTQEQAQAASGEIDASHPAYAFLVKHGLLEHATGLMQHAQEGDDNTMVMPPKAVSSVPAPPSDDEADDPTQLMSTRRSHLQAAQLGNVRPRVSAPPVEAPLDFDYKTENLDPEFLAELRNKQTIQRRVLTTSVVLLVLVLVALQLFK